MIDFAERYGVRMRAEKNFRHVSGAERIVGGEEIESAAAALLRRAMHHPNGAPDVVRLKIVELQRDILTIEPLPLSDPRTDSPLEVRLFLSRELEHLGVAAVPVLDILYSLRGMRGAVLLDCQSLRRLETDHERGVRVTNMDYQSNVGETKDHLKEALCLASKAAHCQNIVGELCISDDCLYTTGYFASRERGYVRLHHIKEKGDPRGGRIFLFRGRDDEVAACLEYLEQQPVLVSL